MKSKFLKHSKLDSFQIRARKTQYAEFVIQPRLCCNQMHKKFKIWTIIESYSCII